MEGDARYAKRHQDILDAISRIIRKNPNTALIRQSDIVSESGVDRRTFRRHFQDINQLIAAQENKYVREFSKQNRKLQVDESAIKNFFIQLTTFIYRRREYFEVTFCRGDHEALNRFLFHLYLIIPEQWPAERPILLMHQAEIYAILEYWYEQNFAIELIDRTIGNLVYFTQTASYRLDVLLNNT